MDSTESRFATLEHAIVELRAQLESARQQRLGSMQRTLQCPACSGERILHVRRVKEAGHGKVLDLGLGTKQGFFSAKPGDPFEVFVCRACGLVEWHLSSFDVIVVDGEEVVELVRESPPASVEPYR